MKKGKCASCEEEEKSWKLKFKRNSSQEIFSTHQREKRGVCDVLKKKEEEADIVRGKLYGEKWKPVYRQHTANGEV